jgi:predicted permease
MAKDFSIKTRSPLLGFVLKDLRIASRNPATAFFFVLPVLETLITTLLISNSETLRTAVVLLATSMGAIFALFLPLALLTAEGKGLEYTKTLPISSLRIVISKTLISTATYLPVPLALIGLSIAKPLTISSSILIPFLALIAVASASIFEIELFLRTVAKSRISAIINDIEKLIVGIIIVLLPQLAYTATFLSTLNHSLSLMAMGTTALVELASTGLTLKENAS